MNIIPYTELQWFPTMKYCIWVSHDFVGIVLKYASIAKTLMTYDSLNI